MSPRGDFDDSDTAISFFLGSISYTVPLYFSTNVSFFCFCLFVYLFIQLALRFVVHGYSIEHEIAVED